MKSSAVRPVVALAVGLLITLTLSAALLVLLADAHRTIGTHAQSDANRLALMVEREISRNVDLIDLSIQAVSDGVEQPTVMSLPIILRDQMLFSRAAAARYVRNISAFGPDGKPIASSLNSGQKLDPLFQQTLFSAHQHLDSNPLLVGKPYFADDGITRLVTFSRTIRSTQGKFDGIVMATVDLNYFSEVLLDLHIGHRTVIQVSLRDGLELIRTLESANRLSTHGNLAQWLIGNFGHWLAQAVDHNAADGPITAQRAVPGTPMVVTVILSSSDVFAEWNERCAQILLLFLAVSLTFVALSAYLAHTLRMRARSEAAVEHMATTDALTELHNRRAFDRIYKHELEHSQAVQRAISVLFIDIDNFKLYNDHYGHVAGDHALQAVAREIKACVKRSSDFVCRYGGEEFVVILPGDDATAAIALAEKIRRAIQQLAIAHVATEMGTLTGSIGIASFDGINHQDRATLLEDADRALYMAKRAGRNRVYTKTHGAAADSPPLELSL